MYGPCREACPLERCRVGYKMQPVEDPERLKTNPRPKWPVPEEVIEWQPSYVQRGGFIMRRSCLLTPLLTAQAEVSRALLHGSA
jgi:hypothetical protein